MAKIIPGGYDPSIYLKSVDPKHNTSKPDEPACKPDDGDIKPHHKPDPDDEPAPTHGAT